MAELALSVLGDNQVHLIDSKPLSVANPKSPYPQRGTPALGKCSSWSKFPEVQRGFSTMGMVFGADLARPWLARELTEGLEDPESPSLELILGDKAYIGIGVLTPKRSNMTRSSNEAVLVRP